MNERTGARGSGSDFYTALAPAMAEIFPLSDQLSGLVDAFLDAIPPASLLDLGAGTGELALHAAAGGHAATAVEPVGAMVDVGERATVAAGLAVRWIQGDLIRETQALAERGERFSVVTCVGNTLPHVGSRAQAAAALAGMYEVLVPGGVAIVQTIHIDRCLDTGGFVLPERSARVEGKKLVLSRTYAPADGGEHLNFATDVRLGDEMTSFVQQHLALRRHELEKMTRAAGFSAVDVHGGYDRSAWSESAPATVIIARRGV